MLLDVSIECVDLVACWMIILLYNGSLYVLVTAVASARSVNILSLYLVLLLQMIIPMVIPTDVHIVVVTRAKTTPPISGLSVELVSGLCDEAGDDMELCSVVEDGNF